MRNCRNREGFKETIFQGKDEWLRLRAGRKTLKLGDLKFLACPLSAITVKTWQMLRFVNETTDPEKTTIIGQPFKGTILDYPPWYRAAVTITRDERNAHRAQELEKGRKEIR